MRLRKVYWIVLRKELRELLRDRRSLFWLFAPPIILPGLALCAGLFIGTQALRIANDGVPVLIENGDLAPNLVARFEADEGTYLVEPTESDPYGDALVVVSIPDDFQQQIDSGGTVTLHMTTRDNSLITFFAESAVHSVINGFRDSIVDQRLADHDLTRAWLDPIRINEGQLVTEDSVSVVAGGDEDDDGPGILATIFLPLAVTSWLVGGGIGLILDTTVGEKERQTIENLLVTPASRIGIVLGKLTVVFFASIVVMSLWMAEGVALNALSVAGPELMGENNLSPTETLDLILNSGNGVVELVIALLVLVVPFIIMLNGVVMAWCARAANYREANLFMVLLQLGLPGTILLTIFSLPTSVAAPVYAIPFFGTIVAIRDLFSSTLTTPALVLNVLSGLVYAALSVGLAAWVFNKEWSVTRGLQ